MGKKGFSLIEVMVVVVIIGVLAAVAIPSYNGYITRTRRADAVSALQTVALCEEKARAESGLYQTEATLIGTYGLKPATGANFTPSEFYDITIAVNNADPTDPEFVAYASPRVGSAQEGDIILALDEDGVGGTAAAVNAALTPNSRLWNSLR